MIDAELNYTLKKMQNGITCKRGNLEKYEVTETMKIFDF